MYKEENGFLREVYSIVLQQSLRHLEQAFKNQLHSGFGHPRFKSKKHRYRSYATVRTYNNIRFEDGALILPKIKPLKSSSIRLFLRRMCLSL
jgi:putative transposase